MKKKGKNSASSRRLAFDEATYYSPRHCYTNIAVGFIVGIQWGQLHLMFLNHMHPHPRLLHTTWELSPTPCGGRRMGLRTWAPLGRTGVVFCQTLLALHNSEYPSLLGIFLLLFLCHFQEFRFGRGPGGLGADGWAQTSESFMFMVQTLFANSYNHAAQGFLLLTMFCELLGSDSERLVIAKAKWTNSGWPSIPPIGQRWPGTRHYLLSHGSLSICRWGSPMAHGFCLAPGRSKTTVPGSQSTSYLCLEWLF